MNSNRYLVILFLALSGCSHKKYRTDNLIELNNKYYNKGKNIPFTGQVISKFENGNISNVINLENGIPKGNWEAYGYGGEIVQNGTFQTMYLRNNVIGSISGIIRISVCTTKEGNQNFIDLFLINNTSKFEIKNRNSSIYEALVDTLKSNKINLNVNSINEIVFTKGELDR